ncbi:hypothetical protein FRB91_001650 [Serendipita sp. 411]|nr:hypothetical protein FRB91_001650 [Serendipita sp. 411]
MVVCQFYLKDQCRFGQNCRNEHPVPKPTGFGGPGWGSNNAPSGTSNTIAFTVESIQRDFAPSDKPLWPLSSYGVAKGEPTFLTGLDISPEELRARAVDRMRRGRSQSYTDYEASLIQSANMTFSKVTNDAQGAFEAAFQLSKSASGANSNPNPSLGGSSTFGQATGTTPNFGQPSFGQPKPFGAPTSSAFGQASTPAFGQSAFGSSTTKPTFGSSTVSGGFGTLGSGTAFGVSNNSAFGNPSGFGTSTSTGAPSGAGGGFSAFASKPAGFGQPAFGQSGFAAVAAAASSGGTPAYAQPEPGGGFGASSSQPFGSSTTAQSFTGSAFTSSSHPASQGSGFSAFAGGGPSAFGTTPGPVPNPFGQSGATGGAPGTSYNTPNASSAFGQQQSQNPLDPQGVTRSAFGQPTTFGPQANSLPVNPFGASTTQVENPFAPKSDTTSLSTVTAGSALGSFGGANAAPSPFGPPVASSVFTPSTFGPSHPPPQTMGGSQLSRPPTKEINIFQSLTGPIVNNRPVNDPYASQLPPSYINILPKEVIEAFASERFKLSDGAIGIPTWIPPLEMR